MTDAQLIWTGNEYEIADATNSDRPDWPVQDQGGRWHREQFPGQVVCFREAQVHFGFNAVAVADQEVPRAADGELNLNDLFLCNNGTVYRAA
jgi:hypothetical protein